MFLSDIFPTGWQAAVHCDIEPTDTVAVWGCGPVGQMCIRSAILLGAKQVVAIDCLPERLSMAEAGGATTINFMKESVVERLNELTHGEGPEKCIVATGLESHGTILEPDTVYGRAKQMVMLENDRPHVLREMIYVCKPAGILSIPGVYSALCDKVPIGALMSKGLTVRTGQTHVNRWTDELLKRIENEEIDPYFVITHTVKLEKGPEMYKVFRDKQDSDRLARGLGWFSLALGTAEIFAPRAITRSLGLEGHEGLIRAYGFREAASGLLSLSVDKQAGL